MNVTDQKRVLLLGGSGYLGTQINHYLRNDSACKTFSTCFTNTEDSLHIPLDVMDEDQLIRILLQTSPDIVIWALMNGQNESVLIQRGLYNLLSNLMDSTKIIYLSTDGVFSQGTGYFTEESEPMPLDEANPLSGYTNAKLTGETMIQGKHSNSLILRIGPIYGQNILGKWDNRIASLINQLKDGHVLSRSSNLFKTFVHVDDLAVAIGELVHSDYTGKLHLGPAAKESYYSFNKKIAASLGLDADKVVPSIISEEEAQSRSLPLDTSLNTSKARMLLRTCFRTI